MSRKRRLHLACQQQHIMMNPQPDSPLLERPGTLGKNPLFIPFYLPILDSQISGDVVSWPIRYLLGCLPRLGLDPLRQVGYLIHMATTTNEEGFRLNCR